MAKSRSQNRKGRRKPRDSSAPKGEGAQKGAIKDNLKKLIAAKREGNMFSRYLRQADVARIMGVGDWKTYERQLERNFEIKPTTPQQEARPRPKITKVSKTKQLKDPI